MRSVLALAIMIGTMAAALADTGPVFVVPGRPGVPVYINGRDASYAVVEGDWGLAKNLHVQPAVFGGGWHGYVKPPVGRYYPSAGHSPGYGRLEVEPPANRRLPQRSESYHRSWSAESAPNPVQPQQNSIPLEPPQIILAPRESERHAPPRFQQFRN